jgi:hypothetical protein
MPFIWGWIVGDALVRIAFSRAVVTLALWYGVVAAGYWLGHSNISPAAGPVTAVVAPVALVGWGLWRPATSKVRLWLIDGIYLWLRLAMWGCLVMVGAKLVVVNFKLADLAPAWPFAVGGGLAWLLQTGLIAWVARGHRRAGGRSLVDVD